MVDFGLQAVRAGTEEPAARSLAAPAWSCASLGEGRASSGTMGASASTFDRADSARGSISRTGPFGAEPDRDPVADGDWVEMDIGPFRVDRLLGAAADVATFLAHRRDSEFAELVALKALRLRLRDPAARQWFAHECAALALIRHPNLVPVIAGGATNAGVPYIATEYVDGLQIARYCAEAQLSLCRRLTLFGDVCRAIDAAHRAGVAHGDVRPSNVLIDAQGMVRVQNLGIARLQSQGRAANSTERAPVAFPEYAAPELLHGSSVSSGSDVYALGVLLHELLLGVRPDHDGLMAPSLRALEVTTDLWMLPASPRALRVQLNGDIDGIVLKALQKDVLRRYATAGAMAEDIDRVLAQWPKRQPAITSALAR